MASYNRVQLIGNLGQDPELRYTQSQTPLTNISIATTDFRNAADGSKQSITEWHRVVIWGRQAENCCKYLKKGSSVFIEGRLQTRSWEDQSGQKRYATEVVASNVQFLNSKPSDDQSGRRSEPAPEAAAAAASSGNGNSSGLDDVPF